MRSRPRFSTYVAKLILTPAGHVVAALVLFNDEPAFFALSVVQILLKKQDFLLVALSLVVSQETFATKLPPAGITGHSCIFFALYDSLAVLLRAQFCIRVINNGLELMDFFIVFLYIGR